MIIFHYLLPLTNCQGIEPAAGLRGCGKIAVPCLHACLSLFLVSFRGSLLSPIWENMDAVSRLIFQAGPC